MSLRFPYILVILFMVFASFTMSFAHEDSDHSYAPVKHVTASEAQTLLKDNPDFKVLDVRTKGEFKRGHIDGAIRVNYFSTKFKRNSAH